MTPYLMLPVMSLVIVFTLVVIVTIDPRGYVSRYFCAFNYMLGSLCHFMLGYSYDSMLWLGLSLLWIAMGLMNYEAHTISSQMNARIAKIDELLNGKIKRIDDLRNEINSLSKEIVDKNNKDEDTTELIRKQLSNIEEFEKMSKKIIDDLEENDIISP